jgi:hypothetical protein
MGDEREKLNLFLDKNAEDELARVDWDKLNQVERGGICSAG